MKTSKAARRAKREIQLLIDSITESTLTNTTTARRFQSQLMNAITQLKAIETEEAAHRNQQLFLFTAHDDFRAQLSEASEKWLL